MTTYKYAKLQRSRYTQKSVKARIKAFFLDNVGKVITRDQLVEVADGRENWHQRLSELRTDEGYTIRSWRDGGGLKVSEYLMPYTTQREVAAKRVRPSPSTWRSILQRASNRCEWNEGSGGECGLGEGETDPIGGGTVHLTPDHKTPHSLDPAADPEDPDRWQALCGRHQVMKKNYWDSFTGKLNAYAIVQAAPEKEKRLVYEFLKQYFGDE